MPSETEHHIIAPVTVTIDVDSILKSSEFGARRGYDPEREDEYAYGGAHLAQLVADALAARLLPDIKKTVIETVKEASLAKVDTILEEVITGPIQLTNSYGERTGGDTTLREQIVKAVNEQLTRKVNKQGSYDRYARDGTISYAQYVADTAASKALKGELDEAVKEAVAEVKTRVKTVVAEDLGAKVAAAVVKAT